MHIGRQEHALLRAAGFQHVFNPAECWDNGGPESGPMMELDPEHEVYYLTLTATTDYTIVSVRGDVAHMAVESAPPGFEDIPF